MARYKALALQAAAAGAANSHHSSGRPKKDTPWCLHASVCVLQLSKCAPLASTAPPPAGAACTRLYGSRLAGSWVVMALEGEVVAMGRRGPMRVQGAGKMWLARLVACAGRGGGGRPSLHVYGLCSAPTGQAVKSPGSAPSPSREGATAVHQTGGAGASGVVEHCDDWPLQLSQAAQMPKLRAVQLLLVLR